MNFFEASKFSGEIITPNDYNCDRQIWNSSIQKFPSAILYCDSENDVSLAMKYVHENECEFRVRGGGHNYEGFCIEDNELLIDISHLKEIKISYVDNTITVGGGVTNGEIYNYLGKLGYPFPGGTCPTVGLAGYSLGGGWGLSCRLFGLGCDNLVEIKMIDYKGEIVKSNRHLNEDLFWAIRGGGGGNFGIITSLTFRLPPQLSKVTLIDISFKKTSIELLCDIMNEFQCLYENLDRRVNMRCSFRNIIDEGLSCYIFGLFYGAPEELEEILSPLISLDGADITFEYCSFLKAIKKIGSIYNDSEMFKSTGTFANRLYTPEEIYALLSPLEMPPLGSTFAAITLYGLGGAVSDISSCDTAFYYRNSSFIIGIQSVWENPIYATINRAWVSYNLNYLKDITNGFYINFPYYYLDDYEKEYYGENVDKLKEIKSKYDPLNLFSFQESIKPN
ncbi:MAG: FAD-dependent oxidoreductase [Clostridium sp.]